MVIKAVKIIMLNFSITIFENLIKSASDNQRTDCQNYTKLRTFIVNVLERKVKSLMVEVKI